MRLYIVGSTAVGKTELALKIHRALEHIFKINPSTPKVEVLSADSVQIYRELKIGSARPSDAELSELKHHLVGHVSVKDEYTAGRFQDDAERVFETQSDLDSNPASRLRKTHWLIVGGSGFYVQALKLGMLPIAKSNPEQIRNLEIELARRGPEAMHLELQEWDPELAQSISARDTYRLLRAHEMKLEFLHQGGRLQTEHGWVSNVTEMKRQQAEIRRSRLDSSMGEAKELTLFLVPPDKAWLEAKLRTRTEKMLSDGLVDEVKDLMRRGLDLRPALSSVGYLQTVQWIRHGRTRESELCDEIVSASLKLAKKQKTWFSRESDSIRLNCATDLDRGVELALEFLTKSHS